LLPLTLPVNPIVVIVNPEQTVCEAGSTQRSESGSPKRVAVIGVPGQPFAVGVMVKVTVTGAFVVFVRLPVIVPDPLAAIPVTATVLSRVH
jgi:hypothetical protein